MSNELVKEILYGKECRDALLSGIQKLSKSVKGTMGVHGKCVIIESPDHTHGITVLRDGYEVAKSINLSHPVENLGARIIKQAAEKTAKTAFDGTTTSIVLAEAIILEGTKIITDSVNRTEVLKQISEITKEIVNQLKGMAIPCDDKIILDVATISSNNDESIGELITKTYKEVGKDGIVTVNNSLSTETYSEVINGFKVARGYSSPYFTTDLEREECVMEKVSILVCNNEISDYVQIEKLLLPSIQKTGKLLIIAPCHQNLISTFVLNVRKTRMPICVIQPPNFGFKQHELMEDIALNVGAVCFSEATGEDLRLIELTDLGFAEKIIVSKDKTVILGGGGVEENIKERATQLEASKKNAKNKHEIDYIDERIASLIGGAGAIFVGGLTDTEQKELFYRVEDAVGAVSSAQEEGIVSGAGKALLEIVIPEDKTKPSEYEIARQIMLKAIRVPAMQILANADLKFEDKYSGNEPIGHGYNLKTGKFGNLIESGVIDPLKVTRTALENAVSVAKTILSTDSSISIARA